MTDVSQDLEEVALKLQAGRNSDEKRREGEVENGESELEEDEEQKKEIEDAAAARAWAESQFHL